MDDMELDPAWNPDLENPNLVVDQGPAQELGLGEAAMVLQQLPELAEQFGDVMEDEWSTFVESIQTVWEDIVTFDGPEGVSEDIIRRTRTISIPDAKKDASRRIPGTLDIVVCEYCCF